MKSTDGYSLAESIVSLVLFSGILMPLIWYFMSNEMTIISIEEQISIERQAYRIIQNETYLQQDSIYINNRSYSVKWANNNQLIFLKIYRKQQKVYEKHFIK